MQHGFNLGFVYEFYNLKSLCSYATSSLPEKHFNRGTSVDVEIKARDIIASERRVFFYQNVPFVRGSLTHDLSLGAVK